MCFGTPAFTLRATVARGTSLRLLCRVSDSPFSEVEVKAFAFTLKSLIESEIVDFGEW